MHYNRYLKIYLRQASRKEITAAIVLGVVGSVFGSLAFYGGTILEGILGVIVGVILGASIGALIGLIFWGKMG